MACLTFDNNCINCLYRHTSSEDPRCVKCLANAKQGSQFPEWAPNPPAAQP